MKFSEMYAQSYPILSVELFPPKTEKGWGNLYRRLSHLKGLPLQFVSVTYGAGGSIRDRTLELTQKVRESIGVTSVPHFTLIGAGKEQIRKFLHESIAQGAENIVALRGDIPKNTLDFPIPSDGFQHANELVAFIRNETDALDIGVAGYPEGHTECRDLVTDMENLKRKVDAGATIVITQLFYDNTDFFRFRERAVKTGVTVPIVAGIMPIVKFSQIKRITSMCGASIPKHLYDTLTKYDMDSAEQRMAGIEYAINQARNLLENDVVGLHIYSLNKWRTVTKLLEGVQDLIEQEN